MAATSFHLKACDISASEVHNRREKDLDYVRKDLSHLNESFSYIDHSLNAELARIKREVKEKTGRKLQKNAVAIKEGVAVIDANTTIGQLKEFCTRCEERFGIKPLQIHIHRDEGHRKAKDWKPNLHAHIVWGMYNDQGRNVRISNIDCAQMQTMLADCLGMERGKQSNKKHLDALQYKVEQLEKQLEERSRELDETQKECTRLKGAYEGVKSGLQDLFTGKARKRAEEAERRAKKAETTSNEVVEIAKARIIEAYSAADKAVKEKERIEKNWETHAQDLAEIKRMRKENAQILEEKVDRETFLSDAAALGLTARQCLDLSKKRSIEVSSVTTEEGNVIAYDNGKPIKLRLERDGIKAFFIATWERARSFVREALHNPWFSVNGIPNDRKKTRSLNV